MILLLGFLFSVYFFSVKTRHAPRTYRSTMFLMACAAVVSLGYLRLGFY